MRLYQLIVARTHEGEIFVISDLSFGKRTPLSDYPLQGRGGKGLQTFEFKEGKRVKPNGSILIGSCYLTASQELVVVTSSHKQHVIASEKTLVDDRKSIGRVIVVLEKNETVTGMYPKVIPIQS